MLWYQVFHSKLTHFDWLRAEKQQHTFSQNIMCCCFLHGFMLCTEYIVFKCVGFGTVKGLHAGVVVTVKQSKVKTNEGL